MRVVLRELNRENWEEAARLSVAPGQENFVASNLYSIAESRFEPSFVPVAIYNEQMKMAGFAMWGYEEERDRWWILRIMIDREYQGHGYGRAAMDAILARLREIPACRAIMISYSPENEVARKLYSTLGFVETGEILGDEVVARLDVDRHV